MGRVDPEVSKEPAHDRGNSTRFSLPHRRDAGAGRGQLQRLRGQGRRVELLFFDRVDGPPTRVDPARIPLHHRTYHYWHVCVPDAQPGQIYAYRAIGPHSPERGLWYDPDKVLLDPYGRAVAVPAGYNREAASQPGDNAATAMKNVVVDSSAYDWEGDQPLRRPIPQTVIYEMHVRGFTQHPSSGRCAREARHVCRAGGKDPLSERPGRHGGRVAARLPVRSDDRPRCGARVRQLLGLPAHCLLRAAHGLQLAARAAQGCSTSSATWSRRCTGPASR